VIIRFGGITLDEKYRDYISLASIFLVLVLMIMLFFLNKTAMVEKGTSAIEELARSLSLRAGRA
jgi:uncharacterized membrane protein YvbJ